MHKLNANRHTNNVRLILGLDMKAYKTTNIVMCMCTCGPCFDHENLIVILDR